MYRRPSLSGLVTQVLDRCSARMYARRVGRAASPGTLASF